MTDKKDDKKKINRPIPKKTKQEKYSVYNRWGRLVPLYKPITSGTRTKI